MQRHVSLWFTLFGASLFVIFGQLSTTPRLTAEPDVEDRVVISAPLQLLLTGGDRFLAADLEAIRAASAGPVSGEPDALHRIRAYRVIAQLNPCHEDSYHLGNALLSWGGAVKEGNELLLRATECRHWDESPPFLYGFNQYYFFHNSSEAHRAFELAANRSTVNYAALMKIAIMIAAGEIEDDHMALEYLKNQRDQASDANLRQMLEQRIERLNGLILLREAQKRFETQFKRPLRTPQELLANGLLQQFPTDPLGLGYEFSNGKFVLGQLKVEGME